LGWLASGSSSLKPLFGETGLTPSSPETFSRNFSAALSFCCPILV